MAETVRIAAIVVPQTRVRKDMGDIASLAASRTETASWELMSSPHVIVDYLMDRVGNLKLSPQGT